MSCRPLYHTICKGLSSSFIVDFGLCNWLRILHFTDTTKELIRLEHFFLYCYPSVLHLMGSESQVFNYSWKRQGDICISCVQNHDRRTSATACNCIYEFIMLYKYFKCIDLNNHL